MDKDGLPDINQGEHTIFIELEGKHGAGKFAMVDKRDHKKVMDYSPKWFGDNLGYAIKRKDKTTVRMHSLIEEKPEGGVINHRNSNRLDNRRSNLKGTTYSENNADTTTYSASGFKGVYATKSGKFKAMKRIGGVKMGLGTFDTAEEASKEYIRLSNVMGHEIHESKVTTKKQRVS